MLLLSFNPFTAMFLFVKKMNSVQQQREHIVLIESFHFSGHTFWLRWQFRI